MVRVEETGSLAEEEDRMHFDVLSMGMRSQRMDNTNPSEGERGIG